MKDRIREILIEVNNEIEGHEADDLISTGLIDSYEIVNLVVELEDAFDIEIDPELVVPENFSTLEAICALMEKIVNP